MSYDELISATTWRGEPLLYNARFGKVDIPSEAFTVMLKRD